MLRYLRENTGNWIIKFFLGIIVIVFVFLGVGSFNSSRNNTVASVNDEPITINEFQDTYRRLVEQMRMRFGENLNDDLLKALNVKQQAIDSLIEQKLMDAQAQKLKIQVTDKELQGSLMGIKAFQKDGSFDLDQYKRVLGRNSLNPEMFEDIQRRNLKQQKVRDMVFASITVSDMEAKNWYRHQYAKTAVDYIKTAPEDFKELQPTEAQVQGEYDSHKDQYKSQPKRKAVYLKFSPEDHEGKVDVTDAQIKNFYDQNQARFKTEEKVEARHILIKVEKDADDEAVETARAKAMEIYEKAKSGEDFSQLAKEYSEGPSGEDGGYLGSFERNAMVKPFSDKAFSMKAGDISEPVRTDFGWHVIKVEARFDASVQTLAQATSEIKEELSRQEMQNMAYYQAGGAFDSIIDGDDLEQVAMIAKKKIMTTAPFTRSGDGLDFPKAAEFAGAAFDVALDDISDVKQLGNDYYLIRVTELIDPQQLPLEAVKDKISDSLAAQLRKDAARQKAEALLEEAKKAEGLAKLAEEKDLPLETTDLFTRNGNIKGIGRAADFAKAAFALTKEKPLHKSVLETPRGFFIISYKDRQDPSETEIAENLAEIKERLVATKQGQYYRDWIAELKEVNRIEINPRFFN